MSARMQSRAKYAAYVGILLCIVYGSDSIAAGALPSSEAVDLNFWFKMLLSGMLTILIYIARNSEKRLEATENRIKQFDVISAQRESTITGHKGQLLFLENEVRQQGIMQQALKEFILTGYHSKEDTERHRDKVETELREIKMRLDTLGRPFHRHTDDEHRT